MPKAAPKNNCSRSIIKYRSGKEDLRLKLHQHACGWPWFPPQMPDVSATFLGGSLGRGKIRRRPPASSHQPTLEPTSTQLPKIIWKQAVSPPMPRPTPHTTPNHSYAANSPLVTMGRPKFTPKITPEYRPIPKPNYLPHPWTHPAYHPKPHPYPISQFSTMHWTDRQRDQQMVGGNVWRL